MRALRENGHDVVPVCEFAKRLEDSDVIDLSAREDRILITEDKDFGQLVYAHGHGLLKSRSSNTSQRTPPARSALCSFRRRRSSSSRGANYL